MNCFSKRSSTKIGQSKTPNISSLLAISVTGDAVGPQFISYNGNPSVMELPLRHYPTKYENSHLGPIRKHDPPVIHTQFASPPEP